MDVLELSRPLINTMVCNSFVVYVLVPLLGAFLPSPANEFSINLSLYLLLEYADTFKVNSDIFEFLCLALFGLDIDTEMLAVIQQPVVLPGTFNATYNHSNLLDRFPQDVDFYCRKLLGSRDGNHECSPPLLSEIQRTSTAIGVDMLTCMKNPDFWLCRYQESKSTAANPIRATLLSFLKV